MKSEVGRRFVYAGTRPELRAQARANSALKSGCATRHSTLLEGCNLINQESGVSISRVSFVQPEDQKHRFLFFLLISEIFE